MSLHIKRPSPRPTPLLVRAVYLHPLPTRGQPRPVLKPLRIGMNLAKRIARSADARDQDAVVRELGPGLPRQHKRHQELVRQRHAYYGDVYDAELQRRAEAERVRQATPVPGDPSSTDSQAGDAAGAVPDASSGPAAE